MRGASRPRVRSLRSSMADGLGAVAVVLMAICASVITTGPTSSPASSAFLSNIVFFMVVPVFNVVRWLGKAGCPGRSSRPLFPAR